MVSAAVGVEEEEVGITGEGDVEMTEEMVVGEVEDLNKEEGLDIRDPLLVVVTQESEPPSDPGNRIHMFQVVVVGEGDAMREGGHRQNQYRQLLPAPFLPHAHLLGGEIDPHLDLARHLLVDLDLDRMIDATRIGAEAVEDGEGVRTIGVDGRLTHEPQDRALHAPRVDDDLSPSLAASRHLPSLVDPVDKIHRQDLDLDLFQRRGH